MKNFSKNDLKTGMRVKFRNGELALVLRNYETVLYGHEDIAFASFNNGFTTGRCYTDTLLRNADNQDNHDIIEIYKSTTDSSLLDKNKLVLLWKRKEETEKELQLEILKALIDSQLKEVNVLQEQYDKILND